MSSSWCNEAHRFTHEHLRADKAEQLTLSLPGTPAAFISSTCEGIGTTFLQPRIIPHYKGCRMSGVEALESVKPTEPAEPEYQVRPTGRAKYAIVLSGERDTVVGWGYDEEGAIKIARALNEAEGQ
jgi:hypothetical protein